MQLLPETLLRWGTVTQTYKHTGTSLSAEVALTPVGILQFVDPGGRICNCLLLNAAKPTYYLFLFLFFQA